MSPLFRIVLYSEKISGVLRGPHPSSVVTPWMRTRPTSIKISVRCKEGARDGSRNEAGRDGIEAAVVTSKLIIDNTLTLKRAKA